MKEEDFFLFHFYLRFSEMLLRFSLFCFHNPQKKKQVQWNSVNKSTSGQQVLDLIGGGFNKRRFLKCTRRFRSKQIGCNKRLDLLTVDLLTEFHCIILFRLRPYYLSVKIVMLRMQLYEIKMCKSYAVLTQRMNATLLNYIMLLALCHPTPESIYKYC